MTTTRLLHGDEVPAGLLNIFNQKVAGRLAENEAPGHWLPTFNSAGEVKGIGQAKYGETETMYFCEVDDEGKVLNIKFSGQIRENGQIDPETGFGTPSVFFTPVKIDKAGRVMIGLTTENRPAMRHRLLVRPDGKYLDLQYNIKTWKHQMGDLVIQLSPREDGLPWADHHGEEIDRIVYRYGVEVIGVPGGYGAGNLNDFEAAAAEMAEEAGILGRAIPVWQGSMDRAWAPVLDIYGFTLVSDESQVGEQNIGDHEEIAEGIKWVYIDEFDLRLCPDNHCRSAIFSVVFQFGLIGSLPEERAWNKNDPWWNK